MRIAITGVTGRVGRALADHLGVLHEVIELSRREWSLTDPRLSHRLADLDFDALLHPASMTSLDECERVPALAEAVNVDGTRRLLEGCEGRPMLYFSTDYVLDGREPGWKGEDAPIRPVSVYGATKAAAEALVGAEGAAVLRVSWVFGPEMPAFPDQILRRALAGEHLAAVDDKFSMPCHTRDLASGVAAWIEAGCPGGVFQACQSGEATSWHGMAELVSEFVFQSGLRPERPLVERLKLSEMKSFIAERPRFTAMSTARLEALTGWKPRPWREAMWEYLEESQGVCR